MRLTETVRRWWSEKAARRQRPEGERAARRVGTGPGRSALAGEPSRRLRTIVAPEVELQLYDDMRRSCPILDVAVTRLAQLCGHPRIEGPAAVREGLELWMGGVPVGPAQFGLGGWLETHLDHMLVYGKGVGRLHLTPSGRDLAAVVSLDPRRVRLESDGGALSVRVIYAPPLSQAEVQPPALTLLSLHAPQGSPHGTSLLRSLPFVTEACSIIENATAQVWQRVGAPSFHVNWELADGFCDPQGSVGQGVTQDLQTSFADIMAARKYGEVKDLFTSGQINISTIGPEGHALDIKEPFRVFAEQIVAVTGLPPWLLGLHWSSTERLSVQQADLLVANIEALRREIQPQIEYLLDLRQRLTGGSGNFRVVWPAVNLRDATEQARADAWSEQARQRRIENARQMWALGFWSQERAARDADETLTSVHRRMELPGEGPERVPGRLTPAMDE